MEVLLDWNTKNLEKTTLQIAASSKHLKVYHVEQNWGLLVMVAVGSVVAVLRPKVVSLFQWCVFANLLGHLMGHILADLLCDTSKVRSLSQLYSVVFS